MLMSRNESDDLYHKWANIATAGTVLSPTINSPTKVEIFTSAKNDINTNIKVSKQPNPNVQ